MGTSLTLWQKILKWFNPLNWGKKFITPPIKIKELYIKAEKGDIVFFSKDNFVGDGIQTGTNSEWTHVAMYSGSHNIIGITIKGMKEEPISNYFKDHRRIQICRYEGITVNNVYNLMSWLYKTMKLHPKYDVEQIVGYITNALLGCELKLDHKDEYICSELVYCDYLENKLPLFNEETQKVEVTPKKLHDSKKIEIIYDLIQE